MSTANPDRAFAVALGALGWFVSDERRAERLLSLTGLTPERLRTRAGDPHMLVNMLQLLENHEPDLLAAADALKCDPTDLVGARITLEREARA